VPIPVIGSNSAPRPFTDELHGHTEVRNGAVEVALFAPRGAPVRLGDAVALEVVKLIKNRAMEAWIFPTCF